MSAGPPKFPFSYRWISEALFREIVDSIVDRGQNYVLLGPRNVGKRYIMHRLPNRLQKRGMANVISLDFHRSETWTTEGELVKVIADSIRQLRESKPLPEDKTGSLECFLRRAISDLGHLIVLATGVDELGPHLSLVFLQAIRAVIDEFPSKLVVVSTGEVNFQDLVHGSGTAFENRAKQIFLQGYDMEEFSKVVRKRAASLVISPPKDNFGSADGDGGSPGSEVESPGGIVLSDEDCRFLHRGTGGQPYLVKELFRAWQDNATSFTPESSWRSMMKFRVTHKVYRTELLQYATDVLRRHPDEWPRLRQLIDGETVNVETDEPTPLELSGVAVRDDKGEHLRAGSFLIRRYLSRYFNTRLWGDWCAQMGRWEDAFDSYRKLDPASCIRPSGPDDRSNTWALVSSYGSHLYALSARPAKDALRLRGEVREALAQGLRLLLGIHGVSFWRYRNGKWEQLDVDKSTSFGDTASPDEILAPGLPKSCQWQEVSESHKNISLLALIASERDDQEEVLVISEAGSGNQLTPERRKLIAALGDAFLHAYEHLTSLARAITQASQRKEFDKIAARTLTHINSTQTPELIFTEAGKALRSVGYRRLFFSLVDPDSSKIRGVVDICDDAAEIDVASQTQVPVGSLSAAGGSENVQAEVVRTRRPVVVRNPSHHPGLDRFLIDAADIGPFALIPLLGQSGDALGTLLIEREDRSVPAAEELEDLMAFCRRLGGAIERCGRVALYEPALQLLRDPIIIIDRSFRIRFANDAATKVFPIERAGWQSIERPLKASDVFCSTADKPIKAPMRQALQKGLRSVQDLTGIGKEQHDMNLVAQPIGVNTTRTGSQPETPAGVMLHFRDHHYFRTGMDVINELSAEVSLARYRERLLELPERLGHQWARLWIASEVMDDDPALAGEKKGSVIGYKSYNYETPVLHEVFADYPDLCLKEEEAGPALTEGNVVIFKVVPKGDCSPCITEGGIPARPFSDPPHSDIFQRKLGDEWINFPLRGSNGKMIGMISMDVPKDKFRARHLVDLQQMARIIGARLTVLLESRHAKAASDKAIADVSHEVGSRLAAFGSLVAQARLLADKYPEMEVFHDQLARFSIGVTTAVDQFKDFHVVPPVIPRALNIREWLRDFVHRMAYDNVTVTGHDEVTVHCDPRHIERCLVEMIKNSRDFAQPGIPLRIEINASTEGQMAFISVRDNGRGVPIGKRKAIFDDFYSYRPDENKNSTGLGLASALRMMEAHGGTIAPPTGYSLEDGHPSTKSGAKFILSWPNIAPPPRTIPESSDHENLSHHEVSVP